MLETWAIAVGETVELYGRYPNGVIALQARFASMEMFRRVFPTVTLRTETNAR